MKTLRRLFTPPVFEEDAKTEQAYFLHIILLVLVFVPVPYVIYMVITHPAESNRAIAQVIFGETANIVLLVMLRNGYVRLASILQVVTFWLFFTLTAFTGNGVRGEGYLVGYWLVISIAGLLLGGVGALFFTILSLLAGWLMAYAEVRNLFVSDFESSPVTTWIVSLVLFPVGAMLQYLWVRQSKDSLARARVSEERWRNIIENAEEIIYTLDLEGNFTFVSPAWTRLLGYSINEVVGRHFREFLHPDDAADGETVLQALKTGRGLRGRPEYRVRHQDGGWHWHASVLTAVKGNDGSLRYFVGIAQDVTENKFAQEQVRRRRATLETIVQLGKQVTEASDLKTTLEKIWHGVHDKLNFDRLGIFLYDQETHAIRGALGTSDDGKIVEEWDYSQSLNRDTPSSFTMALEQPDGVYFTDNFAVVHEIPPGHEMYDVREFAAVTAWGGDKPVAIITVDNMPSQRPIDKEQIEALRLFAGYAGLAIQNARLNSTLEDDLDQRKQLIQELEAKNAELERFTYTVSHDLKSPLVTISGFLGFLEKDILAGRHQKIKGTIERISSATQKMQTLLNDLLELSRVGRLMNPPEDIPFAEIVNEAVDRVHGKLDEVQALVEIQSDFPVVRCDRIRLVEVVQNLIENAAKYSKPNVKPRIKIGTKGFIKDFPIFFVHDNGIGIASQYHEKIFGLFDQLNTSAEGSGIGLTLVKRIIEMHGGKIWLESEPGQGTTFYFTLPPKSVKE